MALHVVVGVVVILQWFWEVVVIFNMDSISRVLSWLGEIGATHRVSSPGGKKGRAVLISMSGVSSSAVNASSVRTVGGVVFWGNPSAVSTGIRPAGSKGMSKPSAVGALGVSSWSRAISSWR